jgi:hypothetical protein
MAVPSDPRRGSAQAGLLIPGLTGVAASGLIVAAWTFDSVHGPPIAFVVLVGGAALLGLIVGNPGNEAALLGGTLLPMALLVAIEPHHGCVAVIGLLVPVLAVVPAILLMFIGLLVGLIVGRETGIQPRKPPGVVVLLGVAALLAVSAWVVLGLNLASGSIC